MAEKSDCVSQLVYEKKGVSPLDVLLGAGVLAIKNVEDRRLGRVLYLEKVCRVNFNALSIVNSKWKLVSDRQFLQKLRKTGSTAIASDSVFIHFLPLILLQAHRILT